MHPDPVTQSGDPLDQLQTGPDRALGIVLTGDREAPDGHHRVADELLQLAAVAGRSRHGTRRSTSLSSSRTSSASRLSERVVKPTRSPNSTLVILRAEICCVCCPTPDGSLLGTAVAQFGQNRAAGGRSAPQAAQVGSAFNGLAQAKQ